MVVTVVMMDASWTLCTGPEKKLDLFCTKQLLKYCHYLQHASPQNSPKVLMRKGKGKSQSWQNPRINNQNQKRPKHIKKNSVKINLYVTFQCGTNFFSSCWWSSQEVMDAYVGVKTESGPMQPDDWYAMQIWRWWWWWWLWSWWWCVTYLQHEWLILWNDLADVTAQLLLPLCWHLKWQQWWGEGGDWDGDGDGDVNIDSNHGGGDGNNANINYARIRTRMWVMVMVKIF